MISTGRPPSTLPKAYISIGRPWTEYPIVCGKTRGDCGCGTGCCAGTEPGVFVVVVVLLASGKWLAQPVNIRQANSIRFIQTPPSHGHALPARAGSRGRRDTQTRSASRTALRRPFGARDPV